MKTTVGGQIYRRWQACGDHPLIGLYLSGERQDEEGCSSWDAEYEFGPFSEREVLRAASFATHQGLTDLEKAQGFVPASDFENGVSSERVRYIVERVMESRRRAERLRRILAA